MRRATAAPRCGIRRFGIRRFGKRLPRWSEMGATCAQGVPSGELFGLFWGHFGALGGVWGLSGTRWLYWFRFCMLGPCWVPFGVIFRPLFEIDVWMHCS